MAVIDYTHIVGDIQRFLDWLGLKEPYGLCGQPIAASTPPLPDDDCVFTCPVCAELAGWDPCPACGIYDGPHSPGTDWTCSNCGGMWTEGWERRIDGLVWRLRMWGERLSGYFPAWVIEREES